MFRSYQSKYRAKRWLRLLLLLLGILLLLCLLRVIYLQRYLVYGEDGVHLDYGSHTTPGLPRDPAAQDEDYILLQEGTGSPEGTAPTGQSLPRYEGYYLTAGQVLSADVRAQVLAAADEGCTLLINMKTDTGKFLYNTALKDAQRAAADLAAIEAWVAALKEKGVRLIGQVPAFADSAYALADYGHSLSIAGGALWMDSNGSYWLDPAAPETAEYLAQTARELQQLGFAEVVFSDFRFPDSSTLRYEGDGNEALLTAAGSVLRKLEASSLSVSFRSPREDVLLQSARLYFSAESGSEAVSAGKQYRDHLTGGDAQLVFLTASRDTRFQPYSLLRPFE